MFSASILELQSQIHYHQEQQELAEQELDRLKMTQAFAEDAANKVEEALEHIAPKYLDVFREHLLSLFPTQAPIYLEEKVEVSDGIEYMVSSHPNYKSIEELQEEEPDTVVAALTSHEVLRTCKEQMEAVFHSEEHLKALSAQRVAQGIEPDYTQDEDWTPEQKAELNWQEQLVRIAPDIFYDPSSSKCYMGFSNRGRATTYGAHLKEIHELYDSRYTVGKPLVVTNCKHELVIECITEENARKLANLNLKKDLEHRSNRDITDKWTHSNNSQDNDFVEDEELDFPAPPYKSIPLSEVELCDLVTTGEYVKAYYEITANKGDHLLARCLYHDSLKHREGEENFWLATPYLVKKG